MPHYQRLFAEAGVDPATLTLETLRRLPILTKTQIRELGPQLIAQGYDPARLKYHKTGGSTGVALQTYFEESWQERRNADAMRANQWAGWYHGMKVAAIWGNPPGPTLSRTSCAARLFDRIIYLDTMRIDDASLDDFVRRWRREQPQVVFGHSHSIFLVARYLQRPGHRRPAPARHRLDVDDAAAARARGDRGRLRLPGDRPLRLRGSER